MKISEINMLSLGLKRLHGIGINTIRQAQIVLALVNASAGNASTPDIAQYTGLEAPAVRAALQVLERNGIVKTVECGGLAAWWTLTNKTWDMITGRR
jgi:DNA-binding IclR family transcriptional regulator